MGYNKMKSKFKKKNKNKNKNKQTNKKTKQNKNYWLHLGRVLLVTICMVVKADICSMHNFLCA